MPGLKDRTALWFGSIFLHVVRHFRSRTDKTHVATKDVPELGHFVQLGLAQKPARSRNAGVAALCNAQSHHAPR